MRILHINTYSHGGAAIAAINLHLALLDAGVDSHILLGYPANYPIKNSYIIHGNSTDKQKIKPKSLFHRLLLSRKLVANGRKAQLFRDAKGNTQELVSPSLDVLSYFNIIEVIKPDIINLHWITELGNLPLVASLSKRYIVVWTLHDMRPFTGGCHFAGECIGYKYDCSNCPAVNSVTVRDEINKSLLSDRLISLKAKFNIVGPSQWMANACASSSLMGSMKSTVIPYSVNISIFKYYNIQIARQQLGLPTNSPILLFVSDSVKNPRKGFRFIEVLLSNPELNNVLFVAVGGNTNAEPDNVRSTGRIDHKTLAVYYAAADLLLLPSVEDNLPNTMLEALCCGCPVVGFNIGGLPDCVTLQNGYLSAEISAQGLKAGIDYVLQAKFDREKISEAAIKLFAPQVQANNYIALYYDILKNH